MPLEYTIKRHKRAREWSLVIHASGDVVVTLPMRAPVERAEMFVEVAFAVDCEDARKA